MKLVDTIKFGVVSGGSLSGAPSYFITLNDTEAKDVGEVAETIQKVIEHQSGGARLVILQGELGLLNATDVYTLAKTFRDRGYGVASITDGIRFYPWMTWISFNVVEIALYAWPGFDVNELRWTYNPEGSPVLPEHPEKCALFVKCNPAQLPEVLNWTRRRKEFWRIMLPGPLYAKELE